MEIVILGAGNLAWHLAKTLENKGQDIIAIYNRTQHKAAELADTLYNTEVASDLNFAGSSADLFILCVSDDAIAGICKEIKLPAGAIIVHTSGSKSIDEIHKNLDKFLNAEVGVGVFYPLMTFSKGYALEFDNIPILIEAEYTDTLSDLGKLGKKLSSSVHNINSSQRLTLHMAAVFACNFTNHLWALSKEIVDAENIDFELLKPLINSTVNKALKAKHPAEVQTGPAVRNDIKTEKLHQQLLKDDTDLLQVYKTLSHSIKDWHE